MVQSECQFLMMIYQVQRIFLTQSDKRIINVKKNGEVMDAICYMPASYQPGMTEKNH
jgi:hypothetical protein